MHSAAPHVGIGQAELSYITRAMVTSRVDQSWAAPIQDLIVRLGLTCDAGQLQLLWCAAA